MSQCSTLAGVVQKTDKTVRPKHIHENDGCPSGLGDAPIIDDTESVENTVNCDEKCDEVMTSDGEAVRPSMDAKAVESREMPETKRSRVIKAPKMPTKAEREAHQVGHATFQPWCKECVQGRGIATPHAARDKLRRVHEVPIIGMDYGFPEGNPRDKAQGDPGEKSGLTILVLKDDRSGSVLCTAVPKKGTTFSGVVKKIAEWIDELGYPKVILKCDQEPSILQVQREVQEKRTS